MSTPEELHRNRLYEQLLLKFGEVAEFIGGWQSHAGTYLDGKLYAFAEELRLAGVQELPRGRAAVAK
jgi:hypothetical protein